MNWENFSELFHPSWRRKLKPFIESSECDRIYEFLKKEGRRGVNLAPLPVHTWRAFKETSFDNLKVVILGMGPYHTFKDGKPVASGILMDCSITGKLQPSLEMFFQAIEKEVYEGRIQGYIRDANLSYLCEQGVLMSNVSLTCEKNKAGSHISIWEPFTKYLLSEVLYGTGVPIVFLGKEASVFKKYVAPFTWTFEVSHPASAAYTHTEWDSEGLFLKLSKILKDSNNEEIEWLRKIL